jgi:hypothetical protein
MNLELWPRNTSIKFKYRLKWKKQWGNELSVCHVGTAKQLITTHEVSQLKQLLCWWLRSWVCIPFPQTIFLKLFSRGFYIILVHKKEWSEAARRALACRDAERSSYQQLLLPSRESLASSRESMKATPGTRFDCTARRLLSLHCYRWLWLCMQMQGKWLHAVMQCR